MFCPCIGKFISLKIFSDSSNLADSTQRAVWGINDLWLLCDCGWCQFFEPKPFDKIWYRSIFKSMQVWDMKILLLYFLGILYGILVFETLLLCSMELFYFVAQLINSTKFMSRLNARSMYWRTHPFSRCATERNDPTSLSYDFFWLFHASWSYFVARTARHCFPGLFSSGLYIWHQSILSPGELFPNSAGFLPCYRYPTAKVRSHHGISLTQYRWMNHTDIMLLHIQASCTTSLLYFY